MKKKADEEKAEARKAKDKSPARKIFDIKEFARYVKPFEWYGSQRDLSPELKRIVKNLACQEHKYVYCPSCKQYEETIYDPVENINKFLDFIKAEQEKINPTPKRDPLRKRRCPELPDDSVSDITDLDQEEVLAKYYEGKLTNIEKRRKERAAARGRLLGEGPKERHVCQTIHKKNMVKAAAAKEEETVELQLRQPAAPVAMVDEDQSAHQFSLNAKSVQADSEERLELEMQASEIERRSDTSPGLKSFRSQRSLVVTPHRKAKQHWDQLALALRHPEKAPKLKNKDKLFTPAKQKTEIAVQTEGTAGKGLGTSMAATRKLESRKTIRFADNMSLDEAHEGESDEPMETADERANKKDPDAYIEDWADSHVCKRAMKAEAIKRGQPYEAYEVADDDFDFDMTTIN